tara:strand:+ start:747 stop:1031 length:285 start_codon:yes stop_codon:yes gene_type:complete
LSFLIPELGFFREELGLTVRLDFVLDVDPFGRPRLVSGFLNGFGKIGTSLDVSESGNSSELGFLPVNKDHQNKGQNHFISQIPATPLLFPSSPH